jgi:hypothetical protein
MGPKKGVQLSVLGSTPQYSKLNYGVLAIKACIMENIKRTTQMGTTAFFLTVRQPSRQFPDKFKMCLGLPSVPGESGGTYQDPSGMGARTHGNLWK